MHDGNASHVSNYFWPPINYAYGMEGLITIHILTMLISVPGNLLVIVVILQSKTLLDESAYLLICSVSVADLLVSVISQPMNIAFLVTGVEHASKTLNYLLFFCVWGFCGASAFGVVCITIDRYLYIMHPMHYTMLLSRRRTFMMIAMQWCCGFAYGLLPMIDINASKYPTGIASLVTLISMTGCMAIIYNRVYKNIRKLRQVDVKKTTSSKNKRKQNNATITIALIVLIFFICWFPYIVTNFINAAGSYNENSSIRAVYYWSTGLGCWNSAFNVIIYGFKNSTLRNEAKKLLGIKQFQIEPESSKTHKDQQKTFMKKATSSSSKKEDNNIQQPLSPLKTMQNSVKTFVMSTPKLISKTLKVPQSKIHKSDCHLEEISRESSEQSISTHLTHVETLTLPNNQSHQLLLPNNQSHQTLQSINQSHQELNNNFRRGSLTNMQDCRKKYSNHLKPPNTSLSESLPDLRKLFTKTTEENMCKRAYENLAYDSDCEVEHL